MKSFHLYRRVPHDLSQATAYGGVLSLVVVAAMLALLVGNVIEYLALKVESVVEFDQLSEAELRAHFNLSLPNLPCSFVSIDLVDALGANVHNVSRGLRRFRIGGGEKAPYQAAAPALKPLSALGDGGAEVERMVVTSAEPSADPVVLPRQEEAAQTMVDASPIAIVAFGSPWSGATARLLPELRKLGGMLRHAGVDGVEVFYANCSAAGTAHIPPAYAERHPELFEVGEGRALNPTQIARSLGPHLGPVWARAGRGSDGTYCGRSPLIALPTVRVHSTARRGGLEYVGPASADAMLAGLLAEFSGGYAAVGEQLARLRGRALEEAQPLLQAFHRSGPRLERGAVREGATPRPMDLVREASEQGGAGTSPVAAALARQQLRERLGLSYAPSGETPAYNRQLHPPTTDGSFFRPAAASGAGGAEGCEVAGSVGVSRVPTTLRVWARADYQDIEPLHVNLTHSVRGLSFGDGEPSGAGPRHAIPPRRGGALAARVSAMRSELGFHTEPLADETFPMRMPYQDLAHYLKVVPASFAFHDGAVGDMYLYAATHRTNLRLGTDPRIHFTVDVTPMRMRVSETRQSLVSFLTHTVAVLGGLFTVVGLLDGAIFYTSSALTKKSL